MEPFSCLSRGNVRSQEAAIRFRDQPPAVRLYVVAKAEWLGMRLLYRYVRFFLLTSPYLPKFFFLLRLRARDLAKFVQVKELNLKLFSIKELEGIGAVVGMNFSPGPCEIKDLAAYASRFRSQILPMKAFSLAPARFHGTSFRRMHRFAAKGASGGREWGWGYLQYGLLSELACNCKFVSGRELESRALDKGFSTGGSVSV